MKRRLLLTGDACYHVLSRVIERRFYLNANEKEVFCDMMRRVAGFSGIEVLTYAVMTNHFHILVRVPARTEIDDDELIRRLKLLYRGRELKEILFQYETWRSTDNEQMLDQFREQYKKRMYDLSQFMKTLKQRFAIWYNQQNNRLGTLWEGDRFISVLVEGGRRVDPGLGSRALLIMAAYIDLNAVRAGMVDDPKDYRWCGYADAVAGVLSARSGLIYVVSAGYGNQVLAGRDDAEEESLKQYRIVLFLEGGGEKGFNAEQVRHVLSIGGELSRGELLRCRVRYFSAGAVLGCRAFVNEVISEQQEYFGSNRENGARRMRGGDWDGLFSARDLQVDVIRVA